jgi:prevent-host-death family protein
MAQISRSIMDTFTVRDLRERTGELIRDAEEGKLSLVTKHGQPVFIAVPFDEWLLRFGLAVALAIRLYEQAVLSLEQASKIAGLAQEEFVEKLGAAGVAVVRYAPDELDQEVAVLQVQQKRRPYRVRKPRR